MKFLATKLSVFVILQKKLACLDLLMYGSGLNNIVKDKLLTVGLSVENDK
jgi:hypothetical protein